MDKLLQTENMLLASKDAENNLENKESARILVVSDSHGESELLEEIIQDFGPGCDALVFCGDGICDIVACLERRAVNRHLCEAFPPVVAVLPQRRRFGLLLLHRRSFCLQYKNLL